MILQLHPRAAPSRGDNLARLQVWVGAFGAEAAPALQWTLDNAVAQPVAMGDNWADTENGCYTQVFEFTEGVTAGRLHRVVATGPEGVQGNLETRALPERVPDAASDSFFNVLLVSCFHFGEDKNGRAGRLISRLPARWRPHLTLLLGDQVYLDIPTLMIYQDKEAWLREKFGGDYSNNWRSAAGKNGYWDILSAAPSVSIPDDHEYWNNFPHPAPLLPLSWDDDGRKRWRKVASDLYDAYQRPFSGSKATVQIDVPPLSFLLIDSRSDRQENGSRALLENALEEVQAWAARVASSGWFGVVATGQSLLAERHARWRKQVVDSGMADHGDYAGLVKAISDLAAQGRPVVLLTGDVHWGRVVKGRSQPSGAVALYEVISSPSSLLTQVGKDTFNSIGNAIAGLFGGGDEWPHHANPKPTPDYFAREVLGKEVPCSRVGELKGNQAITISFQQSGSGLTGRIQGWPIPLDGSEAPPVPMGTLSLGPTV